MSVVGILGVALEPALVVRNVDAYSSTERLNIIVPGTGPRGEGNHFFAPANGNRAKYIKRCVVELIKEEAENYRAFVNTRVDAYGFNVSRRSYGTGLAWAQRLVDEAARRGWEITDLCSVHVRPNVERGSYRVTISIF